MRTLFFVIAIIFLSTLLRAQSGSLDLSYGTKGIVTADIGVVENVRTTGKQVLIAQNGDIYTVLATPFRISRRFQNGVLDSSYGTNGYAAFGRLGSREVSKAALQPDGKLVIVSGLNIERLDLTGQPDASFQHRIIGTIREMSTSDVAVQSDGKIVLTGGTSDESGRYFATVRYNPDGSLDTTFNNTGQVITGFGLRWTPPGRSPAPIPINVAHAYALGIQADGKIVAGGFLDAGYKRHFALVRYNGNGHLDSTFDFDGRQNTTFSTFESGASAFASSLVLQTDGKIVMAGFVEDSFAVARYNTNGSLDSTFNKTGKRTAKVGPGDWQNTSVAVQDNGNIVQTGLLNDVSSFGVVHFTAEGSLDSTFDNDGVLTTNFSTVNPYYVKVIGDKILVFGSRVDSSLLPGLEVLRFNIDARLDNSFASNGKFVEMIKHAQTGYKSIAIQNDGKLIAAGFAWNGNNYDFAVARYEIDGSPDLSFGVDGVQMTDIAGTDEFVVSVLIQQDGKLLLTGNFDYKIALVRYNTNGIPDSTFGNNGKLILLLDGYNFCENAVLQNDGKILLSGTSSPDPDQNTNQFRIVRLNSDGSLDNSFSGDGTLLANFGSSSNSRGLIALAGDGKIVLAGELISDDNKLLLARYTINGNLDNTFSNDGFEVTSPGSNFGLTSLALQNDGKIIVGGNSQDFTQVLYFSLARFEVDGKIDSTFSDDGFQSTFMSPGFNTSTDIAIHPDGRIAVGGVVDNNFGIALYQGNGSLDSTFGTEGVQKNYLGLTSSAIISLAFSNNKLYAGGQGDYPTSSGYVARYLLDEIALPLSLLTFQAVLQNNSVLLSWKVAAEKKIDKFIIERSADGSFFLPIKSTAAVGVTSTAGNYSAVDDQPLKAISYYRLKLAIADGSFTYSNVVAIKPGKNDIFKVFPNPVTTTLHIQVTGENEHGIVRVLDVAGNAVKEFKMLLNGNTYFSLDVSNLSSGVYNLIIYKKGRTEVRTFIKE